jgi:hypothetical protein
MPTPHCARSQGVLIPSGQVHVGIICMCCCMSTMYMRAMRHFLKNFGPAILCCPGTRKRKSTGSRFHGGRSDHMSNYCTFALGVKFASQLPTSIPKLLILFSPIHKTRPLPAMVALLHACAVEVPNEAESGTTPPRRRSPRPTQTAPAPLPVVEQAWGSNVQSSRFKLQ